MIFQQFNLAGRLDVLTNVLDGPDQQHADPARAARNSGPMRRSCNAIRALDRFDLGRLCGPAGREPVRRTAAARRDCPHAGAESRRSFSPMNQWPRSTRATPRLSWMHFRTSIAVQGITVLCNLHSLELARELLPPPHRHEEGPCGVRWKARGPDRRRQSSISTDLRPMTCSTCPLRRHAAAVSTDADSGIRT